MLKGAVYRTTFFGHAAAAQGFSFAQAPRHEMRPSCGKIETSPVLILVQGIKSVGGVVLQGKYPHDGVQEQSGVNNAPTLSRGFGHKIYGTGPWKLC